MSDSNPQNGPSKTITQDLKYHSKPSIRTDGPAGGRQRFYLADDRAIVMYAAREWTVTTSQVAEALGIPHERARRSLARLVKMGQLGILISQTEGRETKYNYVPDYSHLVRSRKKQVYIDCVTEKNRDKRLEGLKTPTEEEIELFRQACKSVPESTLYARLNDNPRVGKDKKKILYPPAIFDKAKEALLKQGKITETYDGGLGEAILKKL